MDFKDILAQWEEMPEGRKESRLSRMIREKDTEPVLPGRQRKTNLESMKPQDQLDLHGITAEEAKLLVERFLEDSVHNQLRKVAIIHGRGLHSPDGKAVLRHVVIETLKVSPYVLEYKNPPLPEGGTGVTWVLLRRKSRFTRYQRSR